MLFLIFFGKNSFGFFFAKKILSSSYIFVDIISRNFNIQSISHFILEKKLLKINLSFCYQAFFKLCNLISIIKLQDVDNFLKRIDVKKHLNK